MRVLIVDGGLADVAGLTRSLQDEGFTILGPVEGTADLYHHAERYKPDAVVIAADAPERDCLEDVAIRVHNSPQPMIMLAGKAGEAMMRRAFEAGVSFYVAPEMSSPLVRSLVQTAVTHHQQARALQAQLAAAQNKLDDQRVVADAKCRLMEREAISETAAYQRLRRAAMDRGSRIAEVARLFLEQS